jgi:hypothetical protein
MRVGIHTFVSGLKTRKTICQDFAPLGATRTPKPDAVFLVVSQQSYCLVFDGSLRTAESVNLKRFAGFFGLRFCTDGSARFALALGFLDDAMPAVCNRSLQKATTIDVRQCCGYVVDLMENAL